MLWAGLVSEETIADMKPVVYIETSIPSFYFETRSEVSAVARRDCTRQWWSQRHENYELVTSLAVLDELDSAPEPKRSQALEFLVQVPVLELADGVEDIVQFYIDRKLMPRDPAGDALHLALASYHKCDFLLTWNCQNLANAEKFHHIRVLNSILGLDVPVLATPEQLMGDDI